MPSAPVFAADLARDLPPADFLRVLELFRTDVVQLTEKIEAAAAAGHPEALRRSAHALAGAAGTVGCADLAAACRIIMRRPDAEMDLAQSAATIRSLADAALQDLDIAIAQARAGGGQVGSA